jgi:flagellar motor switch protein FliM
MIPARLLTNEEIEALLRPDPRKPASAATGPATTYDFDRPSRLTQGARDRLTKAQARTATALGEVLVRHLGLPFELGLTWLGETSFRSLAATWGGQAPVLRGRPRAGAGEVFLSPTAPLYLGAVEKLLGGLPESASAERPPTKAEWAVLEPLHADLLGAVGRALADALGGGLEPLPPLVGFEDLRHFRPRDWFLAMHFGAAAPGIAGELRCAVPLERLAPAAARAARRATGGAPHAAFGPIPLDVTVRLGEGRLTLRDLRELKPRDVVLLDRRPGEPVDVAVGGERKWLGRVGRVGNHLAVRIVENLKP